MDTLGTLCSSQMLQFLLTSLRVSRRLSVLLLLREKGKDKDELQTHKIKILMKTHTDPKSRVQDDPQHYQQASKKMYWGFTVTHNRNVPIVQQLARISLITHRSSQENASTHQRVTQTLHFRTPCL